MKKTIISTLSAIALAVPLGIGGLTLTAPVTATHGEAGWSDFTDWVKETHRRHVEFWEETVVDHFEESLEQTRRRHRSIADFFNTTVLDAFGDSGIGEFFHEDVRNFFTGTVRREFENSFQRTRERHRQVVNAFDNHFNTCSSAAVWACDSSIQEEVVDVDRNLYHTYQPGRLPRGSNGADQAAWDYLSGRAEGNPNSRESRALFEVFPDGRPEETGEQVTVIMPFDEAVEGGGNPFPAGRQREVIGEHRGEIIELQQEVNRSELLIIENAAGVANNASGVLRNEQDIGLLTSAVGRLGEGVHENRQGIALSYAFDPPSLAPGKTFGINGRWGHFEDENGLAINMAFSLGSSWTASLGVGTTELTSSENGVFGAHAGVEFQY